MKHIIIILLTVATLPSFAQTQDTTAQRPFVPPANSGIIGFQKFGGYSIFDSLNAPVARYQALPTDTIAVSWGANLVFCSDCESGLLLVRTMHLKTTFMERYTAAAPTKNDRPEYDEAWLTELGTLYFSLTNTGSVTSMLLAQPNKYSIQWRNAIPFTQPKQ